MNEAVRSAAMTPEQLAVLKTSEWFAALDPAFAQAVLGSSRVMALASGETVFHRGDASEGIYCVLSGAVCFGAIAASGRGSIVALAEAPQWFGEVALFDGGPRTHDAWADISSTVLHLPLRRLTTIPRGGSRWDACWCESSALRSRCSRIWRWNLQGSGWRDVSSICSKDTVRGKPRRRATCGSHRSGSA